MYRLMFSKILRPLFLLAISIPSSATVIVEGTLRGVVSDHQQYVGDHSDFGSLSALTEVTGSFSYSVESNIPNTPGESIFNYTVNWMKSEFTVGGVPFNVAPTTDAVTFSSLFWVKGQDDDWRDFLDMFALLHRYSEKVSPPLPLGPDSIERSAQLQIWGAYDDIDSPQDTFIPGHGSPTYLVLYSRGYDSDGEIYIEALTASIHDLTVASRSVEVPEPRAWILFAIGFSCLMWRRFNTRRLLVGNDVSNNLRFARA